MRKINYPTDKALLEKFHTRYLELFDKTAVGLINIELAKAPLFKRKQLTFERIAVMNFKDLFELKAPLGLFAESYNVQTQVNGDTITTNSFKELFNYTKLQPHIAGFFMAERYLGLKTCYYCGIDYVNSFKDIGDYRDGNDFINRASAGELKIIKGIGDVKADKIIKMRNKGYITSFKQFTNEKGIISSLNAFDFRDTHNHFTLDHIIPQGANNFFSLCLYNLVPSCYSCNAKFKKSINFLDDIGITRISPTSSGYRLTADLKFKILYDIKRNEIKSTEDFILARDVKKNSDQVEKYIEIFKLDGRYAVHKDVILEMIKIKVNYPPRKILKLSREMAKPVQEIKEIIFGKEIFTKDSASALHKLKRDIAKALNIV